jgi:hypothetical protein
VSQSVIQKPTEVKSSFVNGKRVVLSRLYPAPINHNVLTAVRIVL